MPPVLSVQPSGVVLAQQVNSCATIRSNNQVVVVGVCVASSLSLCVPSMK